MFSKRPARGTIRTLATTTTNNNNNDPPPSRATSAAARRAEKEIRDRIDAGEPVSSVECSKLHGDWSRRTDFATGARLLQDRKAAVDYEGTCRRPLKKSALSFGNFTCKRCGKKASEHAVPGAKLTEESFYAGCRVCYDRSSRYEPDYGRALKIYPSRRNKGKWLVDVAWDEKPYARLTIRPGMDVRPRQVDLTDLEYAACEVFDPDYPLPAQLTAPVAAGEAGSATRRAATAAAGKELLQAGLRTTCTADTSRPPVNLPNVLDQLKRAIVEPALREAMANLAGACAELGGGGGDGGSGSARISDLRRKQIMGMCMAKRRQVDDSVWSVEVAKSYADVMRALS